MEQLLESAIQINQGVVVFRLNQEVLGELARLLGESSAEARMFFENLRSVINECVIVGRSYRVQLFQNIDIDHFSAKETEPTQEGLGVYHGFILNLEEFMSDQTKIPLEGRLLFETQGKIFGIAFPFGSTTITATKGWEFVITQGSLLLPAQGYSQILISPIEE